MNELHYSPHAQRRMRQRQVTPADVAAVMNRPIGPPEAGDGGNLVVLGHVRGRRLKVVYTGSRPSLIVTVFWKE